MDYTILIDSIDAQQWEQYAHGFVDYSIYQTWAYQQVRAESDRQEVRRIIIKDENGEAVLMCHLRIKAIRPLGIRIGYVQSGPLMLRERGELDCLPDALKQLRDSCSHMSINVLRVVPNLRNDEVGEKIGGLLEFSGFKKNQRVAPYRTFIVSLKEPEEEILARIHRESRRILKKAEKMLIEVRQGTSHEFFEILENLYAGAKERKGFEGVDSAEYAKTQQMLAQNDKAIVLIAYYDGQPITAHATTHFGTTAVPILTASNETGLSCGTSYLLWWRAYLIAKSLGMERYDLGGVDPDRNPDGYRFKKRMGGDETFYLGAFEMYKNSIVERLWHAAEGAHRLLKKVRV
jgi:lipid II:glycine glycyltransferase (peptidoglycan interpeptide bridge formation enzyme)